LFFLFFDSSCFLVLVGVFFFCGGFFFFFRSRAQFWARYDFPGPGPLRVRGSVPVLIEVVGAAELPVFLGFIKALTEDFTGCWDRITTGGGGTLGNCGGAIFDIATLVLASSPSRPSRTP
ncbi:hypothetical protein, partial [Streptomyces sp. NPDC058086]|uniref:hypothetical protein n=1 Tax=Streptomyces sp. NPDC058086 TaxID=3346334 RepID=UPI0036E1EEAD